MSTSIKFFKNLIKRKKKRVNQYIKFSESVYSNGSTSKQGKRIES